MKNRNYNLQIFRFCIELLKEEFPLKPRKIDRRTIMTKVMVKDAFLELLQNTSYEKITITSLCHQAEITRATFYLHYNNIDEVLDELLDEALRLTELNTLQFTSSIHLENADTQETFDRDAVLPACQRAASNPKYRILFLDESLSQRILKKLYLIQKPYRVPEIMEKYHLSKWEADKLFLFMLHGNFAVNKPLDWNRNEDWYHIQEIINQILEPKKAEK